MQELIIFELQYRNSYLIFVRRKISEKKLNEENYTEEFHWSDIEKDELELF